MKTLVALTVLMASVLTYGKVENSREIPDIDVTTSEAWTNSSGRSFETQDGSSFSTKKPRVNTHRNRSSTPESIAKNNQGTNNSWLYQSTTPNPQRTLTPIQKKSTTFKTHSPEKFPSQIPVETTTYNPFAPEVYIQPQDKEDVFDWKLSQEVFKEHILTKDNVIISPVSIKLLLTILAEAAGQDIDSLTRTELWKVLPFNHTLAGARTFFQNILNSLKVQSKYYSVNVGTRGFVKRGVTLRQKFTADVAYSYGVDVKVLDFDDSTEAAKTVNDWVAMITNGKISSLVDSEGVESCILLLINAIYFKGVWKIPFEETISTQFYSTPSSPQLRNFVQQTGDYFYQYNQELKARFLRLPYEGKRYSMFVILPFEKDGLADIMGKIDAIMIRDVVDQMKLMQVQVTLPKFKFESSMNLNKVIQNLGINEIFKDSATFPNLRSHGIGLKVSNIIQKAGIIVDEKGSEAYAATEIDLVDKFGGDPREFLADHPFLFYIEDDTTGAKLFAGVINNPEFSI